ncbi:MAG: CARDB domain-containing protein [Candidatus Nanohaloarchaea archaeon]|nr:CARDB domain-containing protein [Candidatus Nanohaloarchaea archaeon]
MKKPVLAVLALGLLASAGSAAVEPGVTIESISPQPAEPGDTVRVHVTVRNDGSTAARFAPVDVETVDGVSVIGTTDSIGEPFTLCSGCRLVGTVRLKVAETATSGSYPVDVQLADAQGNGVVETTSLEVDGTPNLVVSAPRIAAVPGENVSTTVQVRNIGTDTAAQTVIDTSASDIAMHPSPLAIGSIAPGETVSVPVTLQVDSALSNGITTLAVTADYRDEAEAVEEDESITVDVLEQASVVLSDVTTDGATVGKTGTITATIENLGPGEAERIVAELSCGDAADVVSGRAFVGQLDDEENVPVTFTLTPRQTRAECDLAVNYADAKQRTVSESFTFAAARQGTSPVLIGVAVVAVIAAGLYWRRTRKQDELAEV